MPNFNFKGLKIVGISTAVPSKIVTLESFNDIFGEENVKKFSKMTGIKQFRKVNVKQTASDLGYSAAEHLLEAKKISKESIGMILFISQSPDYRRPPTAYVLQKRLGISKNCMVMDVNLGCSGFVYGITTIASIMNSSNIDKALLIVAETSTKSVWPNDKSVAMLFGDAGSAILIEKTGDCKDYINASLYADGYQYKSIILPGGGYRMPDADNNPFIGKDGCEHTFYHQIMNGLDVFNFSLTDVISSIQVFLENNKCNIDDYDIFAFHQPNIFILKQIIKKLNINPEKFLISLDKYGNNSNASIPLCLCHNYGNNINSFVGRVLMCGFGTGLSWGIIETVIDTNNIYEIIESDDSYDEGILSKDEI